MAPSAPIVAALFRLSSASLDEQSMLQMPVVEKSVETDASDCACPGYYEEQCTANAFQGCIWSSDNLGHHSKGWTDEGHSDAPWCQCDPNFEGTPPLFDAPPAPPAPVVPPAAPDTRSQCGAQPDLVATSRHFYGDPRFALGPVGKGCPQNHGGEAPCLNGNTPYSTLEEAWAQCEQVSECGNILMWTDGNYYLRRDTDPDVTTGRTVPFCLGLSSAPDLKPFCVASINNVPWIPEWESPGKGCPSGGSCLNDNIGYATYNEARAQCEVVSGCENILEWTNGNYYLRRETDPDVTAGRTRHFCQSWSSEQWLAYRPSVYFDQRDSALWGGYGTLTGDGQLGWNTAANSAFEVSQGDDVCGISFKCDTAESHLMIGLVDNQVTRWQDINFGLTCRGAWAPYIDLYESGSHVHRKEGQANNGNPSSDVHALRVNADGRVEFSLNGAVYYTSSGTVPYPWHVGLDTYTAPSLADMEYLQC